MPSRTCSQILLSSRMFWPGLYEKNFPLSMFSLMIQISRKRTYLAQKRYFFKRTTNEQIWKVKVNFWPKPLYTKWMLHKTIKFGTLMQLSCCMFLLRSRKSFEVIKNANKCKLFLLLIIIIIIIFITDLFNVDIKFIIKIT